MVVTFHKNVVFNGFDESEKVSKWVEFVDDLKQQRLKGTYPLATKRHAISTTVFFGLLFVGISLLLKSANRQVVLKKFRYDNVSGDIRFEIKHFIPPPVYFYYELKNTFSMHRSFNNAFCIVEFIPQKDLFLPTSYRYKCNIYKLKTHLCKENGNPEVRLDYTCMNESDQFYAPIGGAASIMFNDSFVLSRDGEPISWTEEGIVDDRLLESIQKPEDENGDLCEDKMFKNTIKPIGWDRHICEMGGYRNASLLKWLEPSTNKNFKKLYRILNDTTHVRGLPPGNYTLRSDNTYWPIMSWSRENRMEKYFWILHPSWVGTEQKFLEVMYLIVGIGLLTLASFLIGFQIFMMNRRKKYCDEE